jgi:hypothetical protein
VVAATSWAGTLEGSYDHHSTGTYTGFVKYTFSDQPGVAQVTLSGMTNPTVHVDFSSLTGGTFHLSSSGGCEIATLVSGTGLGAASITAHNSLGLPGGGQIKTGGKQMQAGDYLEACLS